jgi:hypothetical protein
MFNSKPVNFIKERAKPFNARYGKEYTAFKVSKV